MIGSEKVRMTMPVVGPYSAAAIVNGEIRWLCALDQDFNVFAAQIELPRTVAATDLIALSASGEGVSILTARGDLFVWRSATGRWSAPTSLVDPPAGARDAR